MGRRQPPGHLRHDEPTPRGSGPSPHSRTRARTPAPTDPEAAARAACLTMLSVRARTRAELMAGLSKRDFPNEVTAGVLDRFTEVGLIDDTAFAAAFVSARHRDRGLARNELSRQLRAKGVADDVVAAAVSSIDDEAERSAARALIARKARGMSQLPEHVQARRLIGLLARKGYSPGLCYAAVREVLGELAVKEPESDTR